MQEGNDIEPLQTIRISGIASIMVWVLATVGCALPNTNMESDRETAPKWRAVSVGESLICGLEVSGAVHCWGMEPQIGESGGLEFQQNSVSFQGEEGEFVDIAVSGDRLCALDANNQLNCWLIWSKKHIYSGWAREVVVRQNQVFILSPDGRIERTWFAMSNAETIADADELRRHITAGAANYISPFACWIDFDGMIHCKSSTHLAGMCLGQVELYIEHTGRKPTTRHEPWAPQPPDGVFIEVSCGIEFGSETCCSIDDSYQLSCWGKTVDEIDNIPANEGVVAVEVGNNSACAIAISGAIFCWGRWYEGQNFSNPPAGEFRALAVGKEFACAIDDQGELECWGENPPQFPVLLSE